MNAIRNREYQDYKIEFNNQKDYEKFKKLDYNIIRDQKEYNQVTVRLKKEEINDLFKTLISFDLKFISEVKYTLEKYFIVRIAWVFGVNGKNFIRTMLNVGKTHDTVRVVNDQIGTPTYTYDLARLLVDMAESEKYGYYHATNEGGYISWSRSTVTIMRRMRAGISAGTTLLARSIVRRDIQQKLSPSRRRSTDSPRQNVRSTAVWISANLWKPAFSPFPIGETRWRDI